MSRTIAMRILFTTLVCTIFLHGTFGQDRVIGRVAERIADLEEQQTLFTNVELFAVAPAQPTRDGSIDAIVAQASFLGLRTDALLDVLADRPAQLALAIPTTDGVVELHLERVDMFANDFSMVIASTNVVAQHVPGLHYRGTIAGDPASLAAISIFQEEVMGVVSDGDGDHVLGKIDGDATHIYYAGHDLHVTPSMECATADDGTYSPGQLEDVGSARSAGCVRLYWEVNNDIFLDKGSLTNTANYITGLFNQHATLFDNDGISVLLSEVFIWDVASPYTSTTTSGLLGQFQSYRNSFSGDLGHLLGYAGGGGLAAGVNGLCASNLDNSMCYSGIDASYSGVPVYSWSVMVVTHEEGHLLGSRHTHACAWNGNNTAIDGCGPAAGYPYEGSCSGAPIPGVGGTIMSYCHLNAVGVNFISGFGPQPTTVILNSVNGATCVTACTAGCDTPSGLSIATSTATSATLAWVAVSGATSYTLQWKASASTDWTTVTGIATTSHTVNGLAPGMSYLFRVLAVCGTGSSVYSSSVPFSTVCGTPTGLNATNVTDTSVSLAWSAVPGAVSYTLQWTLNGNWININDIATNSYTKTGLLVGTPYDFRVRCVCTSGTSAYTPILSLPTTGCGGPRDLYATNVTNGSALLSWTAPPLAITYTLQWKPTSSGSWISVQGIPTNSYVLAGLDPNTSYDFRVFSWCGATTSVQYSIVSFITLACVPFSACDDGDPCTVDDVLDYACNCSNGPTDRWEQVVKVVPDVRHANDQFGEAIAISGDHAIIGAPQDDQLLFEGTALSNAGAAYVFVRSGNTWLQQQKLVASDAGENDLFGASVAIDGDLAVVGAWSEDHNASGTGSLSNAGSAYIFVRNGSTWTQQQKIVAGDRSAYAYFGICVAISGDQIFVGASHEGDDVNGANNIGGAGAGYLFVRDGSTWSQQQKIVASDRAEVDFFGGFVAMNGDDLVVGATAEDEDASGGNYVDGAGSAYIFHRDGTIWSQVQKIVAGDRGELENFGGGLAIDGERIIVGASRDNEDAAGGNTCMWSGAAYIFSRSGTVWSQQQKIVAHDRGVKYDMFGVDVAIEGDLVLVGAHNEDENVAGSETAQDAGAVYYFTWNGSSWIQQQKILAEDRSLGDSFGWDIALDGDQVVVGARADDENAAGADTLAFAGSAYVFALAPPPPPPVSLRVRVKLGGPYASGAGIMNDALRSLTVFPLVEPYSGMGLANAGGGGGEITTPSLLSLTGLDAIVDWVRLELRSSAAPGTILATKQVLVQRDGDIVDAAGCPDIRFDVPNGEYHLAVRHRNHLGVMTATPVTLSPTSTAIDFTSPATSTYGTNAQSNVNGTMVLWQGDVTFDATVRYTGANNDRDPILSAIGGLVPTAVLNSVYSPLDVNMDGRVKYLGINNDRDPILQAVGGSVPTATRVQQLP